MRNIKLEIEYDGTRYSGWQRQKNSLSIEETVENAVRKITKEDIKLIGSSRTDSGVHAKGQVANFNTLASIPVDRFSYAINTKLPKDIVVLNACEVPMDFHARYSCKGKRYSYMILNREFTSPLLRNYAAHCSYKLDLESMKSAAEHFLGTHDFEAFRSTGSSVKTSVRTVSLIQLEKQDNDIIKMFIEADGFLYNMVRIIAGTLMEVGRGRISPNSIPSIIESKNRDLAGKTAPAQGLYLEKIYY